MSVVDIDVKVMVNYENNVCEFYVLLCKFYYYYLFEVLEFLLVSFK